MQGDRQSFRLVRREGVAPLGIIPVFGATVVLLLALILLVPLSAQAQSAGGYGIEGRATPSDLIQLASDIAKITIAETILEGYDISRRGPGTAHDIGEIIGLERQKEMLGIDDKFNVQELGESVRSWWVDHILKPALDVTRNPAASCAIAQSMLIRIYNLEKQGQMLGLDGAFGVIGDSDSDIRKAFDRVQERCLQEAFDECMATGSGQALFQLVGGADRQMQLFAIEPPANWNERVIYLLRRCTVFKVKYHTEIADLRFGGFAVLDGSYVVLLEPREATDPAIALHNPYWMTRPQDPREIQLTSLRCPRRKECRQSTQFMKGEACGIITKKRDATEWTFTVVQNTAEHPGTTELEKIAGAHVEWSKKEHHEGKNTLVLQFLPPDFYVEEKAPEDDEYFDSSIDIVTFDEAILAGNIEPAPDSPCPLAPLLVNDDTWVAGTYPTIYSTAHTATTRSGSETTHFDIVHRPDLFPADEIDESLELKPPPEPPQRTPAQ